MRYTVICLAIIVACGGFLKTSTYAKEYKYYGGDEYGESIDEQYGRQDDAENAQVPILSLSRTGSEITLDIAGNTDISARRKAVVIKGLELVGFTKYNMGSKAANDSIKKPTYLDCSGFVQWAVVRATGYDVGHGTAAQYANSIKIEERDLQVGDLGFIKAGGVQNLGGGNHVGIYVGNDKRGEKLWLHCSSGNQNGVNITTYPKFIHFTRPGAY